MPASDFLCRPETRRVLWVMGGVVAFSILLQLSELPYRNFIGSLFSGLNSNRMNTHINGFDEKISGNDTVFSTRNPVSVQSSAQLNYSFGVELLKPERNLVPERAEEFGNIFRGNDGNVAPMLDEQNKDDSIPLQSNIASPPMITPDLQVDDNLTAPSSTHDEVRVIVVPLNLNATIQAPSVSHRHVDTDDNSATHNSNEATGLLRNDLPSSGNGTKTPVAKKAKDKPMDGVVSISEMTNMLLRNTHLSDLLTNPMWSLASDEELLRAKSQMETAANNISDPGLYAPVYHNVSMFKRSYELMERTLKIYIYKEGEKPIFHQPKLRGIYASEGWFMKQLKASQHFLTDDPNKAHLFYLPFSSQILEEVVYVPGSHSFDKLKAVLNNYLDLIKGRYPFWNRTQGADHFLVACHDWAPEETRREMANCIKSLCNADLKEGFKFGKDASLPETNIVSTDPSRTLGGKRPSQRKFLAFFAGSMHGYVRPVLLKHWQDKEPSMKIFGRMHYSDYILYMKSSKYCICARGHEVNSPRVVEAISYQCVPVIISDNFVPPFLETLNWETFAVFVQEKDIPNLKSILESIPLRTYLKLYNNVMKVQQHFLWHPEPVKYDTFHMILHSIWYNRVSQIAS